MAGWAWTFEYFVRDVPGSFEFWMENMMDQSHVPHAHSEVAVKTRQASDHHSTGVYIHHTLTC